MKLFIATGEPASGSCEAFFVNCLACDRVTISTLKRRLLRQPHTSAGGVTAHAAFRVYPSPAVLDEISDHDRRWIRFCESSTPRRRRLNQRGRKVAQPVAAASFRSAIDAVPIKTLRFIVTGPEQLLSVLFLPMALWCQFGNQGDAIPSGTGETARFPMNSVKVKLKEVRTTLENCRRKRPRKKLFSRW